MWSGRKYSSGCPSRPVLWSASDRSQLPDRGVQAMTHEDVALLRNGDTAHGVRVGLSHLTLFGNTKLVDDTLTLSSSA
jgi:hypothetical protein